MIRQVDHVLFVLWYISIYNNLQGKQIKDIINSNKIVDVLDCNPFAKFLSIDLKKYFGLLNI